MIGSIEAAGTAVQDSTSSGARTNSDLHLNYYLFIIRNNNNYNDNRPGARLVGAGLETPLPFGLGGAAASGAALIKGRDNGGFS